LLRNHKTADHLPKTKSEPITDIWRVRAVIWAILQIWNEYMQPIAFLNRESKGPENAALGQ